MPQNLKVTKCVEYPRGETAAILKRSVFNILRRRKLPTDTTLFMEQIYPTVKPLLSRHQLSRSQHPFCRERWIHNLEALISRWRKKGWISGERGISYLWTGPAKLSEVLAG